MLENYKTLAIVTSKNHVADFLIKNDAIKIAQQLCLNNYNIFKNIHPLEFLNEICKRDNAPSPSFQHFVSRFDTESYWVNTELILIAKSLKDRIKILTKFIYIAKVAFEFNARSAQLIIIFFRHSPSYPV
jgi:hypothetical protein